MAEKADGTRSSGNGFSGFSRRQFLERLGITTSGAFVATLSLMSGCKSADPASTTNTTRKTETTSPTTTTQSDIFSYTPDDEFPFVDIPGTSCTVATDRLYTDYHTWVKQVLPDVVILGITPSMVEILAEPYQLELSEVGFSVTRDESCGTTLGGWKVSSDIFSPVSGEIILVNDYLKNYIHGDGIQPIEDHPFTSGWIVAIQMSDPSELDDLLSWQQYVKRLGKT